jgi:hypothetical protein
MDYQLTIHERPTYLHAIVAGRNTKENVEGYAKELLAACVARQCRRVLVEERLEGPRLGLVEVFEMMSEGSHKLRGIFEAIAFIDHNREGDLMQFAETIAFNRGFPLRCFEGVEEAERWLLQQGGEHGAAAPSPQPKPAPEGEV